MTKRLIDESRKYLTLIDRCSPKICEHVCLYCIKSTNLSQTPFYLFNHLYILLIFISFVIDSSVESSWLKEQKVTEIIYYYNYYVIYTSKQPGHWRIMLNHWKNTDCSNKVWRNSMNVYCWTQQASLTFCGSCLVKAEWVWPLTPVAVSLQGRFTAAWRGRRGGRRVQAAAAARRSVSDLQPPNIWLLFTWSL